MAVERISAGQSTRARGCEAASSVPSHLNTGTSSTSRDVQGYRLELLPNGYVRVQCPSGLVGLVDQRGYRGSVRLPSHVMGHAQGMALR